MPANSNTERIKTMPKTKKPKLTEEGAARLADQIINDSNFDDGVTRALITLMDGIMEACMDSTRVENLAAAARDHAFTLTFDFERAQKAYLAGAARADR